MRPLNCLIALVMLAVILLISVIPSAPVEASGCSYYSTNYRPYVAPTYYAPAYHSCTPYAIPVAISPDYFYSVRDQTITDAAAFRAAQLLLNTGGLRGQGYTPPITPPPNPVGPFTPKKEEASSLNTPVDPKLQSFVNTTCVQCHTTANKSGGLDLSNLATVPEVIRHRCLFKVQAKQMPLDPKDKKTVLPVSEENTGLLAQWTYQAMVAQK